MDVQDVSGEASGDTSLAQNGEIHKYRLTPQGKRIGLGEYIPPKRDIRFGSFVLARPMEVSVVHASRSFCIPLSGSRSSSQQAILGATNTAVICANSACQINPFPQPPTPQPGPFITRLWSRSGNATCTQMPAPKLLNCGVLFINLQAHMSARGLAGGVTIHSLYILSR